MKQCNKCGKWKFFGQFKKDPRNKSGLFGWCKQCVSDHYKVAARRKYAANVEKQRERARKYHAAHPDQVLIDYTTRRARIAKAEGRFTAQEWRDLKELYNHTCLRCGRHEPEIKLTPDHVLPLSKGGSNSIGNIQPLCGSCNSSKYVNHIDYRQRKSADHF